MKKSIGSYEAKTKLPSILERVARGESFTITKRGQPIADLLPVGKIGMDPLDEAVQAIKELRKKHTLKGGSIRKMIGQGRR